MYIRRVSLYWRFHCIHFMQSNKFTATLAYDSASHHPTQRMPAEVSLKENFKFFVQVVNRESVSLLTKYVDIQNCTISIEPPEVAQNRKRRWSRKFPIMVSCPSGPKKFKVYLFSPTARDKEDWIWCLKGAAGCMTSQKLIEKQEEFFGYMEKYFPPELLSSMSLWPKNKPKKVPTQHRQSSRSSVGAQHLANTRVQFTKTAEADDEVPSSEEQEVGGVNITQKVSGQRQQVGDSPPQSRRQRSSTDLPTSSLDECGFEHVQYPTVNVCRPLGHADSHPNQWLNSLAARFCWDV